MSFKLDFSKVTLIPSWNSIEEKCLQLAEQISNIEHGKEIKGIIAIARGGLIPATIVASSLGIRRIIAMQVEAYSNREISNAVIIDLHVLQFLNTDKEDHWIIIDDIVSSGATLKRVKSFLEKNTKNQYSYYTLFGMPNRMTWIHSGHKLDKSVGWVQFPWEKNRKEDS